MFISIRRLRAAGAALSATALAAGLAAGVLAGPAAAAPSAVSSRLGAAARPGLAGGPIVVTAGQQFSGYDVAADAAGTAYIGWISDRAVGGTGRAVHLCTLPVGATKCTGGVQTISALDVSTATDLHVLVTPSDQVDVVWFHNTEPAAENGPQGGEIAEATAAHGLHLSAGHDVASAPSFGDLLDAEFGPGGTIWTVSYAGVPTRSLQVRPGFTAATKTVKTPFGIGFAELAFAKGRAVLAIEKAGAITTPADYASTSATGAWGSFRTVARTWTGAGATLKTTRVGLRLVTGVNNSSYRPVIANWTGSGFGPRQLTADHNSCAPSTHDGSTDPSGRLLDVSWECGQVTIADYVDAEHAAVIRFRVSGTGTYTPQIASGTRGIATVAWTAEGSVGQVLRVAHVRLPDTTRTVSHSGVGGRVFVTGPTSCLPPVDVRVGWRHPAARHWHFRSGSLLLNGRRVSGSTIHGSALAAGRRFALVGTAVFRKGARHSVVRTRLTFTTCAAR